ncbi:MAG: PUR family DNA/RNA-binding protein [Gammaproteobacteria bacterium]|nr:PUR family DNA/RNA-binding protein [Gammaproteobacteria bacterium]
MEDELRSEKIQVERKVFFLDLKENQRGKFLKITEDVGGRRDTIIIPATGLPEIAEVLQEMIEDEGIEGPDAQPQD